MARPGITYQDVANAAQEIYSQGQNPTIETIRHQLGTGSSTTIATHLKAWKTKQQETQQFIGKEKLPDELVASLKGLWSQLVAQAEAKITIIREETRLEISDLHHQLLALKTSKNQWEDQAKQLTQEKLGLVNDKLGLEQGMTELQKQMALSNSQIEALKQQIEEKQDRVNELHKLHTQTQANLEHYRQSTREQRLLEQQRFEQQKQEMEQIIHQSQQKIIAFTNEKLSMQQNYERLTYENKTTLEGLNKSQKEVESLQAMLALAEKLKIENAQAKQYWEEQHQILSKKFESQSERLLDLQKELAVASQQSKLVQNQVTELTEQNKALALEKWAFGQQKATLEGQLKQLQLILEKLTLRKVSA